MRTAEKSVTRILSDALKICIHKAPGGNVFVSADNICSNVISHQRNNEENVCIVLRKLRNNGLELGGANRVYRGCRFTRTQICSNCLTR